MQKLLKRWLSLVLAISLAVSMLPATALARDETETTVGEKVLMEVQARSASSGTCGDNLTWELSEDGVLTISGTGEMTEKGWSTADVNALVIEEGVTGIMGYAFAFCDKMKSVSIPDSVVSIGNYAFEYCSSLTEITIPGGTASIGMGAFIYCTALTAVTLQDGVETIGAEAFSECSSLAGIQIPESVTSLGAHAFKKCLLLTDITLPSGLTELGGDSFYGCKSLTDIVIPDGITSIGAYTFQGCSSLEHVVIPESVTSISQSAFCDCKSLTDITLPEGLTSIDTSVFSGCSKLESVNIPESVTAIEASAFANCSSLSSITIPAGVSSMGGSVFSNCELLKTAGPVGGGYNIEFGWTERIPANAFNHCNTLTGVAIPDGITAIGSSAFDYCSSLTSIVIPESVTSIGTTVFDGCTELKTAGPVGGDYNIEFGWTEKIPANAFRYSAALTSVELPDSITEIGNDAFYSCKVLTDISLPDALTVLGANSFYNCSSLTEMTIPGKVAKVGSQAFRGCSGLTSVTIQYGVTGIDSYAFHGCSNLEQVVIPESVTTIGTSAFYGCVSLESVSLPDSVTSMAGTVFSGCSGLVSVSLPEKLAVIGDYAFQNCTGLTNVSIPAGLITMGKYVFYGCEMLETAGPSGGGYDIEFGWTEAIPDYAFASCSNLTAVDIPYGIASIGSYAFQNCRVLGRVTVPDSVTSISQTAFLSCPNLILEVLPGSFAAEFAVNNGISYEYITADAKLLQLTVSDENGESVSEGYTVAWYNGSEKIGSGNRITVADGITTLTWKLELEESLAFTYYPPEAQQTDASASQEITCVLRRIPTVTVTGAVAGSEGSPLAGAQVTLTQLADGGYGKEVELVTDADGRYSAEVLNLPTVAEILAEGCLKRSITVIRDRADGNVDAGTEMLSRMPENKVTMTLKLTNAAAEGETAVSSALLNTNGLEFSVYNETRKRAVSDFTVQYPYLILGEGEADGGDTIRVSVTDSRKTMTAVPAVFVLDGQKMGELELNFIQNGYFTADLVGTSSGTLLVFDGNGRLVSRTSAASTVLCSDLLPAGTYQAVVMQKTNLLAAVSDISLLTDFGLTEGRDYTKVNVAIRNGILTELGDVTVPKLDESRISYTESSRTTVTANKSAALAGSMVQIRAEYEMKTQYTASGQNVIIEIPEGVQFVQNSVTLNGNAANYTYENQRVTVYTNRAEGTVRFYVISMESGEWEIGGMLNFTLEGRDVTQPLGTAHFTASALTMEVPERTGKKEITVTGKARANSTVTVFDNHVEAGTATANAAGSWSLTFELVNPYTYSYHDLYALVENEMYEQALVTDTATVIYQSDYMNVSRVTMYNTSHGAFDLQPYENVTVFDFEHPGKPGSYRMWPGRYTSFTFVIGFTGDASLVQNVVLHVFVKSGDVYSYDAAYDGGRNAWIVNTNFYTFAEAPVNVGVDYSFEPPEDTDYSVTACPEAEEDTCQYLEYFDDVFEDLIDVQIKEETDEGLTLFYNVIGYEDMGWEMTIRELDYAAFDTDGLESQGFTLCEADDPSEKPQYIRVTMDEREVVYTLVDAEFEYAYSYTVPISFALTTEQKTQSAGTVARKVTYENMNVWARILWDMTEYVAPGPIPQLAAQLDYSYLVRMLEEKSLNAKAREEYIVTLMTLKCSDTGSMRLSPAALAEAQSRYQALLLQESYTYNALRSELDVYLQKIMNSYALNAITAGLGSLVASSGKTMRVLKNSKNIKYTKYIVRSTVLRQYIGDVGNAAFKLSVNLGQYISEPVADFFAYFDVSGSQYWLDIRKAYLDLDILFDALENDIRSNYQKCSDDKLPGRDTRKGPDVDKTPISDPSGYVCEAVSSNRLEGVTATLYYLGDETDEYGEPTGNQVEYEWNAEDYDQINPLITDVNGSYAWDVPEGQWRVKYEKEGYETTYSEWLPVPPPQTEVNVAMVSSTAPEVSTVNAYRDNIRITFTQYMEIPSVGIENITVTVDGEAISGRITPYDEETSFEDESISYARTFVFTPDRELSGEAEICVSDAVNYAGTSMKNTYSEVREVVEEPKLIEAADSMEISYHSEGQLSIQVMPEEAGRGLVITAKSTSPSIVSTAAESVTVGEDGRAALTLLGSLPGSAEIVLTIEGTDITKTVTAEVINTSTPAKPVCAKVTASTASGSAVPAGTKISLSTETEGAEIYYTIDGTCPCDVDSPSRLKYTGPIEITAETFLIAYAVKEGCVDSPTTGFLYYISEEKEEPDGGEGTPLRPDAGTSKIPLKAGAVFTGSDGILKYKVVKVSDGKSAGQVQVTGLAKNKAKISIPATVTDPVTAETFRVVSIAAKAFKGNKKITSVVIGKNVTSIGANAFSSCKKLKAVTLGTGVRTIGSKAFCKCAGLKKITVKSQKLSKVGKNAISGIYKKAVIKVPAKKVKAYNKKFNKKTGRKAAMKVTK